MLLSWGRMEEDIEADNLRQEVQDWALQWGKMVSGVLGDLNVAPIASAGDIVTIT